MGPCALACFASCLALSLYAWCWVTTTHKKVIETKLGKFARCYLHLHDGHGVGMIFIQWWSAMLGRHTAVRQQAVEEEFMQMVNGLPEFTKEVSVCLPCRPARWCGVRRMSCRKRVLQSSKVPHSSPR